MNSEPIEMWDTNIDPSLEKKIYKQGMITGAICATVGIVAGFAVLAWG